MSELLWTVTFLLGFLFIVPLVFPLYERYLMWVWDNIEK